MVEISTIAYKRHIDSLGMNYNKILNFCKSKKWGDDFKGTEYEEIINEFQDAVIWILRKAKYYKSVDVHYVEDLKNDSYNYTKEDIEKSKVRVFKDFDRKELCDYFMYYTIDVNKAEWEDKDNDNICYMNEVIGEKTDADIIAVINNILDGLKYNAAKYFYNSVKQEGWIDSRVKSKVYHILQIEDESEKEQKEKKKIYHKVLADKVLNWIGTGSRNKDSREAWV